MIGHQNSRWKKPGHVPPGFFREYPHHLVNAVKCGIRSLLKNRSTGSTAFAFFCFSENLSIPFLFHTNMVNRQDEFLLNKGETILQQLPSAINTINTALPTISSTLQQVLSVLQQLLNVLGGLPLPLQNNQQSFTFLSQWSVSVQRDALLAHT